MAGFKGLNSKNSFIDTCVIINYANGSQDDFRHVDTMFNDTKTKGEARALFASTVVWAELLPSRFNPGRFATLGSLREYLEQTITFVTPMPPEMIVTAELRDIAWVRKGASDMKERRLTGLDAMHLASALFIRDTLGISDLEFVTVDNKAAPSPELPGNEKTLPLLSLDQHVPKSILPEGHAGHRLMTLPIVCPKFPQGELF